ncbi:hypothetical protein JZ751_029300 [Albula glossodonta]|uniref:SLAIN motif family member 1 n=1 Tax=Albula glossodonta TaxID=121402 RepID=A0A8T2P642_9TELE|nr:hypothetical protein JZ751_029300 [Albula glossodonta]
MADVNCNKNVANAELEVKKLQELVRKLEKQNEQLRTRANAVNACPATSHILQSSPACLYSSSVGAVASPVLSGSYYIPSPVSPLLCPSALDQYCAPEEPYAYFHPHSATYAEAEDLCNGIAEPTVLDEVEILDLNSILPCNEGSEDTWYCSRDSLYTPPKARLWTEFSLSPLQWSRQVLDNPRPEVEAAKRSLCHKLAQAHRWRGVLSSRASSASPRPPIVGVSPLCSSYKPCSKPVLTEQSASFSSFSHSPLNPTQTANRKDYSGLAERSPSFLYHSANQSSSRRLLPLSRQSSVDSELSTSELEDDSIAMGYKLQDLTDVQIMARLQEESLRQDYASVNRRSSSFSYRPRRPMSSQLELANEEDCDHMPPPEPRMVRATPLQRGLPHSLSFSGARDCRRSPSAPQYLNSLSFQQSCGPTMSGYTPDTHSQSHRPSRDKLQRSMPNLLRAPSIPSVPNVFSAPSLAGHPSSMRTSQSFDSSHGPGKLQSSSQLQHRFHSVGSFSGTSRPPLKATAYVSPTVQCPTPKSSHSSIPQPNKAGTQSAMGRSALPRPASFICSGAIPRGRTTQTLRSLLTPPKSLSALSTLRDGSWRDGCY